MLIQELYQTFQISVRAYNVCNDLGLTTVDDLAKFLYANGGFKSAKNCGNKTNDEIIAIIQQYHDKDTPDITINSLEEFASPSDERLFDIFLSHEVNTLSVRARNALLTLADNNQPSFKSLRTSFLSRHFTSLGLQNVGVLTAKEIDSFRQKLFDFYKSIEEGRISEREREIYFFNSLIGFECNEEHYVSGFIDRTFPLFQFISDYAQDVFQLSDLDQFIFKNRFYLLDRHFKLDEIASKFNLSRERIRQKTNSINKKIEAGAFILKNLKPYCNFESLRVEQEPFVSLSNQDAEAVSRDNCKLNPIFVSFFASILFSDNKYSFTKLDKFKKPDEIQFYYLYDEVKAIRGSYVIDKKLITKENLFNLYVSVISYYCERRSTEESIRLDMVLKKPISDQLRDTISKFIYSEFELEVMEDSIVFPRNTNKLIFEYAVQALEKLNKPSHISEILEEVIALHPDYDSGEDALRGSIGRYKDIFIYFGRSSTYGLKSWENKKKNIKGGTIKGIIEEYLQGETEPKHISDVLNYLRKFRDTNYNSVVTNLKVDPKKKFKFFGNGYIGLVSKQYEGSAFGLEVKTAGEIEWEKILELIL